MNGDSIGEHKSLKTGRSVGAELGAGLKTASWTLYVGILLWGWLIARWLNDWLHGVIVPAGEPFINPAVFSNFAASLSSLSASIGVFGWPISQLAGFFEAVAFVSPHLPMLANGAWLTVLLTVFVIVLGFGFAIPLSVARVYGKYLSYISLAYTELIRGTPLLAQLFLLYYGFPQLSQWLNEISVIANGPLPSPVFWVAVIGFTLNDAAYQSEYIRGAIEGVNTEQITAGRSIGLSKFESIRHIVLPQALRYAIPSWTNDLVYLIKYTSFAAFITVPELFYRIENITSTTFRFMELYVVAVIFYLLFVITASELMTTIEKRMSVPGIGNNDTR